MRVLLINTNRISPPVAPLALDYIGTAVRSEGHDVEMLDLCWTTDAPRAIADAFASRVVDLAAVTFRNTDDCYFASGRSFIPVLQDDLAMVRAQFDGPIVVGGAGFSLMASQLLDLVGAPYGVRGDGDAALPALTRAVRGDISLPEVPGLVYREQGRWQQNAPAEADLQARSLAGRDIVDNRRYFARGGQAGIETKRGCPGRCIYCADPVIKGRRVRLRPPADVVAEVRSLLAQGIDHLHLCDSEFNIPESHAADICRALIDAGLGGRIRWYTYASPVPFSPNLATLMRRAGCAGINFGADHGADRMLAALGRDFTAAEVRRAVQACRDAGIAVMVDLLIGAPGETWDTVSQAIELMKAVSPDCAGISLGVRVYPGTALAARLAKAADRRGLIGDATGIEPAFFLSPDLGDEPHQRVRALVGQDERFFFPFGRDEQDYNYNDNAVLQHAIDAGWRGAYWDILRQVRAKR
jgi:radical SAM superfamily enzyme YgiQ (UPF0313 family)